MAITLTSITPETIFPQGGYLLEIYGTFVLNEAHTVYVGSTGTTSDPICHSGKPGQGNTVYPVSTSKLKAYSPELDPDGTYTVLVVGETSGNGSLADSITTVKRDYQSQIFKIRSVFPPFYKTGARNTKQLEAV